MFRTAEAYKARKNIARDSFFLKIAFSCWVVLVIESVTEVQFYNSEFSWLCVALGFG